MCTATYSLVINGETCGYIRGLKGLRQGDPISPLLFVLIMNCLTRLLSKAASHPRFRYHPGYKHMRICNLCFADDLLIFCKGSMPMVKVVLDVFQCFSASTGLVANQPKSNVYFGGFPERAQ